MHVIHPFANAMVPIVVHGFTLMSRPVFCTLMSCPGREKTSCATLSSSNAVERSDNSLKR